MTAAEAGELWQLGTSTVKRACQSGRFHPHEARKSGGTWLVTASGMTRVYGHMPNKKEEPTMILWKKGNTLIVQNGFNSATSYTFEKDDYTSISEIPRSDEEWEKLGYKKIDISEAKEMFYDAGFSETPLTAE